MKGRKGIGKFAGLMAASEMTLETKARGVCSRFTLRLKDLAEVEDIEQLPITITSEPCHAELHGTTITLQELHAELAFPEPKRMRQVLLYEYGRAAGIEIFVGDKMLAVDDVVGTYNSQRFDVSGVGEVTLRFSIADEKAANRQAGLVLRVDGKAVGKPSFFGLDEQEDFPQKLKSKLYGEIDADGLRDHVTAGWDSVIENSDLLNAVKAQVQPALVVAFRERYGRELQLAQARVTRSLHERLAALPEYRREYADKAIKRVLERFFGEDPVKIEPYVYVLLEAIEHSEYGLVLSHIHDASRKDVAAVAGALAEFGLAEMAFLVNRAKARHEFLDELERLACDPKTREVQMHQAIERNLWIFGPEYTLFSSNTTLKRQIAEMLGTQYSGEKASNRPDLLLNEDLYGSCLLIEFKRPTHGLKHGDYLQAIGYRHELLKSVHKPIRVLVMGGKRSPDFPMGNKEPEVSVTTFSDVIATARKQLDWQLSVQALN